MQFPLSAGRFLTVWLSMAIAMSANGIFRELILKRYVSERVAGVISATIGIAFIGVITRIGLRPFTRSAPTVGQLLAVSGALVVLTIVFECVLGRYVDHKSWTQLLDHYALWRGELWPIVLIWLALTPFVWRYSGTP